MTTLSTSWRVRFLLVLDVHAVDAVAELQHALDRVFAAADEVAAIDAGPDPLVVALDRLRSRCRACRNEAPGP